MRIFLLTILFSWSFAHTNNAYSRTKIWNLCVYNLRTAFTRTVTSLQQFDRVEFFKKLYETEFYDKNGDIFKFYDRGSSVFYGDVIHSRYGGISAAGDWNPFGDRLITQTGDLSWGDTYMEYPKEYKNLGFVSAFFEFAKKNLPEGAEFIFQDATEASWLSYVLLNETTDIEIESLIRANENIAELYRFFTKLTSLETFDKLYRSKYLWKSRFNSRVSNDKKRYVPFLRYLADIGTKWGRIAIKGSFRSDYFSPYFANGFMIKRDIPEELLIKEKDLLKTLPPNFFESVFK